MPTQFTPDAWDTLRQFTSARIAIGRSGGSVPTQELLSFQSHHARAIDAVYTEFDRDALAKSLAASGIDSIVADTRASTRQEYLQRPDWGRALSDDARERLSEYAATRDAPDVALLVVDGLSSLAVHRYAAAVVTGLVEQLRSKDFAVGPVVLVRYGRVAVQDEIGSILGATVALSLIGERPGLGSPDSLGAYLVHQPKPGNTDANRNCVSNIRAGGLSTAGAIDTLEWLVTESLRRKISGVELKDDRQLVVPGVSDDTPRLD